MIRSNDIFCVAKLDELEHLQNVHVIIVHKNSKDYLPDLSDLPDLSAKTKKHLIVRLTLLTFINENK